MKICILQSSYEGSNSIFKSVDSYCSPAPYSRGNHIFEAVLIKKATAFQQIRELSKKGFDVFINLCDGAFDEDRAGFEVVQILEYFNLPFTGANSSFYEPSKEVMKMMAYYYGVRTPEFVFAYNDEDIEEAIERLNFPLIVKHYNGYSSIGMTEKSKCSNAEELRKEAKKMVKEFGGALIEEFIEGNEYTVLVTENPENPNEPYALLPIEEIFDSGETFKHFDLKWKEFNNIQWRACQDEKLAEELKEMSKKMFVALGGVGYGRTDMRVNSKGEAFFLEINPNCGIFYPKDEKNPDALGSADFILVHDKNFDHHKFIEHIINCALYQHRKRQKIVEVRFKPSRGYGLYANRDILEGEIVQQNEEKPHYLVTKRYVESNWKDQIKKKWFYPHKTLLGSLYPTYTPLPPQQTTYSFTPPL
jgi:D-alanine-D-alanine ligase-like ATP-grasp enzyme